MLEIVLDVVFYLSTTKYSAHTFSSFCVPLFHFIILVRPAEMVELRALVGRDATDGGARALHSVGVGVPGDLAVCRSRAEARPSRNPCGRGGVLRRRCCHLRLGRGYGGASAAICGGAVGHGGPSCGTLLI